MSAATFLLPTKYVLYKRCTHPHPIDMSTFDIYSSYIYCLFTTTTLQLLVSHTATYIYACSFCFYRDPIGKYHVQVCTTTPCMVRGAYEILDECKKVLGVGAGGE